MSNRFIKQSQRVVIGMCATVALTGFYACTDNYDLDENGNNPSWLGKSIYEELENPQGSKLTGTFQTYLRLIDDLGYKEVMSKTGSKTVFVANDSAFNEFFKNNSWGVSSYEQLTEPMKKQLFYASMLDNAILTEGLSNVDDGGTSLSRGVAMKHQTAANATDTVYYIMADNLPQNNSYWAQYAKNGIHVVMDNTRPMLIHFTREQMLNNSITNKDFEIITGKSYDGNSTYIYKNKVIMQDMTCLNGYINQLDGVVVPPGNLAKVIRDGSDTKWFSRMMDRYCAPYYDASTTMNYNDAAVLNGTAVIDSIYQLRYFSERSQGALSLIRDPKGVSVANENLLRFDPGWNQYYSTYGNSLADVGAMFVPSDEAIEQYFLHTVAGDKLISLYAKKPNTLENFAENLDSIPSNIVCSFVNNAMNASFVQTVPSKFTSILDEASDPMGITEDELCVNADGTKDVRIANNGVIYMMSNVIPPVTYNIVSTPAFLRSKRDLGVINWAIQSKQKSSSDTENFASLNFYAYLRASSANYAMFLPNNEAFDAYYVDPVSLGKNYSKSNKEGARVLHFYFRKATDENPSVSYFKYDPRTGSITDPTDSTRISSLSTVHDRLKDILNYHTVSLAQGQVFGGNSYYKTKHGGEIKISGTSKGNSVMSGAQINGKLDVSGEALPKSVFTEDPSSYSNGKSFVINHLIQAPHTSVYGCLDNHSQFSEFMKLCEEQDDKKILLNWAGITKSDEQKQFTVFSDQFDKSTYDCIDFNVYFFNSYNYTLYAPDNTAMAKAYSMGLPTWEDVRALKAKSDAETDKEKKQAMANQGLAMIEAIRNFIRYHFQDYSIYADNTLDYGDAPTGNGGRVYQTSCFENGIYQKLTISGGNKRIEIKDNANRTVSVDAKDEHLLSNFMARDYIFNNSKIETSSFAAIHEISEPLCNSTTGRYDSAWANKSVAARKKLASHRQALISAQRKGVKFYK